MSTKPAAQVTPASADSLESKAYASVSTIATVEPNDRNRLGYHVWRWLLNRQGSLEEAVSESGARLNVTRQQAATTISESLKKSGISI